MELVGCLIPEGCGHDVRDLEGRTPLSFAVGSTIREGRIGSVKALLKRKADVHSKDVEG